MQTAMSYLAEEQSLIEALDHLVGGPAERWMRADFLCGCLQGLRDFIVAKPPAVAPKPCTHGKCEYWEYKGKPLQAYFAELQALCALTPIDKDADTLIAEHTLSFNNGGIYSLQLKLDTFNYILKSIMSICPNVDAIYLAQKDKSHHIDQTLSANIMGILNTAHTCAEFLEGIKKANSMSSQSEGGQPTRCWLPASGHFS